MFGFESVITLNPDELEFAHTGYDMPLVMTAKLTNNTRNIWPNIAYTVEPMIAFKL